MAIPLHYIHNGGNKHPDHKYMGVSFVNWKSNLFSVLVIVAPDNNMNIMFIVRLTMLWYDLIACVNTCSDLFITIFFL